MRVKVADHCRDFLKFLMREFPELLIEVETEVIVSENFLLWTIREMIS